MSLYISYLVCGKLGDLFHVLYVPYENYKKNGKKAIIYFSEKNEAFQNGLQTTFDDLKPILLQQKYIENVKIHNDEIIEIDLSLWRLNGSLNYGWNWYQIFKKTFDVSWGCEKWIELPTKKEFENCILISNSLLERRNNYSFDYKQLLKQNKKVIFIGTKLEEYENFKKFTLCDWEYIIFENLLDVCLAINSCYLFVGNLSSPLAIAYACNTKNIAILSRYYSPEDKRIVGLEKINDCFEWYLQPNYSTIKSL